MSAAAIGDWREHAACASGYSPELWFPGPGRETTQGEIAKAICLFDCPVRDRCLTEALSRGIDNQHGIWGGTTERQRRRVLARRLSAEAGKPVRAQARRTA